MFRVLAYNVNGLRGGEESVATVVRACAPDIACIQESPQFVRSRSRCARLARRCGLRRVAGGYPAGLLILGNHGVRVLHIDSRWLSFVPRRLQRGLTLAVVEVGGSRVTVANMHLDLDPPGRARHAREVLDRLCVVYRRYGGAVVLAGDLNEGPRDPVWGRLAEHFQDTYAVAPCGDGPTLPADQPRLRIDGIFASSDLVVRGAGVPGVEGVATASDHCPVVAELGWSGSLPTP